MKYFLLLLISFLLSFSSTLKLNNASDEEELNNFLELQKEKFFKCLLRRKKANNLEQCTNDSDRKPLKCVFVTSSNNGMSRYNTCVAHKKMRERCNCNEDCISGRCSYDRDQRHYICKNKK